MMLPTILNAIRATESRYNIRSVFSCESGSRAWGFDSRESDYDVRIIYVRPKAEYVRLVPPSDAFDVRFAEPEFADLDIGCWDIRKAANLLWRSNPPLMEWLGSPVTYEENTHIVESMRECASVYFDKQKSAFHYVSMARNVVDVIVKSSEIKRKKYLYALRPLACVRYLATFGSMPPTRFQDVLGAIKWPYEVKDAIDKLIAEKKAGELGLGFDPILHSFCVAEMDVAVALAENFVRDRRSDQDVGVEKLDKLIADTIFLEGLK